MAAVMGIDYGDSRIGIAVSDGLGIVATPRCIVDGKKSLAETVAAIGGIYEAEKCDTVVIGYPINMDGSYGNRIHRTEKFIEKFKRSVEFASVLGAPIMMIPVCQTGFGSRELDRAMCE